MQTRETRHAGVISVRPPLVGGLVFAGCTAGFAVHQTVVAKANIDDGLAKAAEFFTLARSFGLFALCTL